MNPPPPTAGEDRHDKNININIKNMKKEKEYTIEVGGRQLKATFSDLAPQTNGSVLVQYGETTVLATATMGEEREGLDYFPLTVEYSEKFYAVGKILGSRFIRRENRPTDNAILTGRLIDRTLRPLFDDRLRSEVQIVLSVLSIDDANDPDFVALTAASLALATSDIPWGGPISGLRIGKDENNQLKVNSTYEEREKNNFDVFASVIDKRINMIEVGTDEAIEKEIVESMEMAINEAEKINEWQRKIVSEIGIDKKEINIVENVGFKNEVINFLKEKGLEKAIYAGQKQKMKDDLRDVEFELKEWLVGQEKSDLIKDAMNIMEEEIGKIVSKNILESEKRPDGRKLDEIREIYCEVDVLPKRVHGSGLFMRGLTHALSNITLASPGRGLTIENIEFSGEKNFIHHYNFPPFSVGEARPMRGPGRREIGHGALAEKALLPIIPNKSEFPYTIRVVSEILSSNGSSSMASACGSVLALMDAGVPIKKPVAGIAMGLILGKNDEYKVLTDIQGPEDHYGDMDLKIAGTRDGITACQLDVKIKGITLEMIEKTLEQAKNARLKIIEKIEETIKEPRKELSPFAPKISSTKIDPDKIGMVIGSGGKTIKDIMEKTKTEIDIDDDGSIFVTGLESEGVDRAIKMIEDMTKEYKVGDIVEGEVVKIMDFGAFVQLDPYQDGMVHISEISHSRTEKVEDALKVGQKVKVKVIRVEDGRLSLSMKAMIENNGSAEVVDLKRRNKRSDRKFKNF